MTLAALAMGAIDSPAQEISAAALQPRNDAGFMAIKRSFNATALTVVPGVDCDDEEKACELNSAVWHKGRFWVLGREGWCCALSAAVHRKTFIHEWTADGAYIQTHEIPLPVDPEDEYSTGSAQSDSAPEVRDMATDEWRYDAGSKQWVPTGGEAVFIGSEEGIHVTRYNTVSAQWELWDRIQRQNGTATVAAGDFSNPIRGPGLAALRTNGTPELPHPLAAGDTINGEGEGYMGVAYDPNGNGGQGSFWVGADDGSGTDGLVALGDPRGFDDPTDPLSQRTEYHVRGNALHNTKPILEIDLHGNILTTLHNGTLVTDPNDPLYTHWDPDGSGAVEPDEFLATGGEWVAGGLELDPLTGNLWVQMNMDQQLFEVGTTTGDATGFAQDGFVLSPGRTGGLTGIPNGDPGPDAGFWDLLSFSNVVAARRLTAGRWSFESDDYFSIHRVHQYPDLNGLTEPRLLTAVNPKAGPRTLAPAKRDSVLAYTSAQNIDLLIDETGQGSAAPNQRPDASSFPAVVMLDINAATDTDASTDLVPFGLPGVLPELRVHSLLSDPDPLNAGLAPAFIVPYLLSFAIPTDTVVPFPAPSFVPTGQKIRMQAVYYDSRSQYGPGLMVTNEAWMVGVGSDQVMVEVVGETSMDVSPEGFFRIHYLGGPAIEFVELNLHDTTSNPGIRTAWFDMDQTGMGGWAGAGRGWDPLANGGLGGMVALPGCNSTYRQDSDISTGLVYATQYDYPAPLDTYEPMPQYIPGSYGFTSFRSPACDFYTEELGFEFRSGLSGIPNRHHACITPWWDDLGHLTFQFADFDDIGDVFRFDCDTDGGFSGPSSLAPMSAEDHTGLRVTVIFAGGQVETGELLPDPNGGRAFIGW